MSFRVARKPEQKYVSEIAGIEFDIIATLLAIRA